MSAPKPYKRPNECLFCASRRCCNRIVTRDGAYDELACQSHGRQLAAHADEALNGAMRMNCSTTGHYRRGENAGFEDFDAPKEAPQPCTP